MLTGGKLMQDGMSCSKTIALVQQALRTYNIAVQQYVNIESYLTVAGRSTPYSEATTAVQRYAVIEI